MSAGDSPARRDPGYTGLTVSREGLAASMYFDAAHYARELAAIWYESWIYVCPARQLPAARDYLTFELGDQSILLLRDESGRIRAYHNTCRHRGAALCRTSEGRLPPAGIVCAYHGWRYNLRGELLQTSSKSSAEGFDVRDFPLYPVAVREWNGLVFISLAKDPPSFETTFDQPLDRLDRWHLADLVVGHTLRKTIACNWKVFWENYNECLHCPGVHPKLVQLVPLFSRGLQDPRDDPAWRDHAQDEDPKYTGRLRAGAESWTMDGRPVGIAFPDVSEADRKAGQIYITGIPSVFIVAHVDYVRIVRLRPLGPEQMELSAEFLFLPETLADPSRDIMKAVEFTGLVMGEDGDVCELNQRGLRARAHSHGVVMPEEYLIAQFQDWVRDRLGAAAGRDGKTLR